MEVTIINPVDINVFKLQSLQDMLRTRPLIAIGDGENVLTISPPLPGIVCADGTWISVQGGKNYFCEPREDNVPYTHVEVGYPTAEPSAVWKEYAEDKNAAFGDTIYAEVPIELVYFYIGAHGGIDIEKTFPADFKFDIEPTV